MTDLALALRGLRRDRAFCDRRDPHPGRGALRQHCGVRPDQRRPSAAAAVPRAGPSRVGLVDADRPRQGLLLHPELRGFSERSKGRLGVCGPRGMGRDPHRLGSTRASPGPAGDGGPLRAAGRDARPRPHAASRRRRGRRPARGGPEPRRMVGTVRRRPRRLGAHPDPRRRGARGGGRPALRLRPAELRVRPRAAPGPGRRSAALRPRHELPPGDRAAASGSVRRGRPGGDGGPDRAAAGAVPAGERQAHASAGACSCETSCPVPTAPGYCSCPAPSPSFS